MSIQLKTTRVRPSITINPRGVILLKEYRHTHRLNVENEITLRIEERLTYHLDKMLDTQMEK